MADNKAPAAAGRARRWSTTIYGAVKVERSFHQNGLAQCQDCMRLDDDATPAQIRDHVIDTGHSVSYLVGHLSVYQPIGGL